MEILKFPDPFLLKETASVVVFGEELKVLLDSMWETMEANNGLGLAANQVGLSFRMFVMKGPQGRIDLVNPEIVNRSKAPANLQEGCLSAPGDFVSVPSRVDMVQVKFQDSQGNKKIVTLRGIYAVCAQHEIEHLNGRTFMSNKSIPKATRYELAKKWSLK